MVSGFCTTCTNPLQTSVSSLPLVWRPDFRQHHRHAEPLCSAERVRHIQPRFGVSYQITPKLVGARRRGTVLLQHTRSTAGAGISALDQLCLRVRRLCAAKQSSSSPFPVSAGLPQGVNLPTGSSLGLSTALGQSFSYTEPTTGASRSSCSIPPASNISCPAKTVLQISYVGNKVFQLPVNKAIDVLPASYQGHRRLAADWQSNRCLAKQGTSPFAGLSQMAGSSLAAWQQSLSSGSMGLTLKSQVSPITSSPSGPFCTTRSRVSVNKRCPITLI